VVKKGGWGQKHGPLNPRDNTNYFLSKRKNHRRKKKGSLRTGEKRGEKATTPVILTLGGAGCR